MNIGTTVREPRTFARSVSKMGSRPLEGRKWHISAVFMGKPTRSGAATPGANSRQICLISPTRLQQCLNWSNAGAGIREYRCPAFRRARPEGYNVVKTNLLMSRFLPTLMSEETLPPRGSAVSGPAGRYPALRPRTPVTMIRRRICCRLQRSQLLQASTFTRVSARDPPAGEEDYPV